MAGAHVHEQTIGDFVLSTNWFAIDESVQFQQRCNAISDCVTFLGVTNTTGCVDAPCLLHELRILMTSTHP